MTNILVADVTGDGVPDVLWGAGATSTGPDHLYTARWSDKKIIWQNVDLVGPFLGPVVGDLDGDGIPEIVFASTYSDATYSSGRIIVLDSRTFAVRAISGPVMENRAWAGVHDLKLRDLRGNGRLSIVLAADNLYDGQLEAWSFSKRNRFRRHWTNTTRPGQPFYSVEVADLEGDGRLEVIAGAGNAVYAYDGATGDLKWQSLQMQGDAITGLGIADFDGDGALEILAQGQGGYDYVLDGSTHGVEAVIFGPTGALRVTQPSGQLSQAVLGGADGRVAAYGYDGSQYAELWTWSTGTGAIAGIQTSAEGDWWIGSEGVLTQYRNGQAAFTTASYGAGMGRDVAFLPNKGLVLSGAAYGVFGFPMPGGSAANASAAPAFAADDD